MRPFMFGLGVLTMAHPFGAAGLITLFPAWGALGFFRALRVPMLKRMMLVAALWSASMVISAEAHNLKLVTQLALYGVVVILSVSALWWFHTSLGMRRETVVIMAALGWLILATTHGRDVGFSGNAWKYAIGSPITILLLAILWRFRAPRLVTMAVLGGLAVYSILHDSRFPAGFAVAVAVATLMHRRREVTRASVVRQLVVFAVAVVLVFVSYPPLADHGYFGHRAREQQAEINSEGVNFMFANRPEMLQSAWIAAHHPGLGIGPGATLSNEESGRSLQFLVGLGLPIDVNRSRYLQGEDEQGNPGRGYAAHSSGIDSVTHGGLLAAPFWIFYVFLLFRMVLTRSRESVFAVPTVLSVGLLGLWDVLFSPLLGGQWIELSLALFLAASAPPARPSATVDEDADAESVRSGPPVAARTVA
jgi:hypothetical protein